MTTLGSWLHVPELKRVRIGQERLGCQPVTLETARGDVETRFCPSSGSSRAVILVGGAGGGFDTPAMGLYERLSEALPPRGLSVLRVRYRDSRDLSEAVHDLLAGIHFLTERGVTQLALVGHSFGGAVVILGATLTPEVRAVITLATQSHGAEGVENLSPRSLLLIHGVDDEILRPKSSVYVFKQAKQPKEITLYEGATHTLDEVADELFDQVQGWLMAKMSSRAAGSREAQAPVSPG